jgi:tellurite resistance protein TerC
MSVPVWLWGLFGGALVVILSVDLLSHRDGHADSRRAAVAWSAAWIGVGLAFTAAVWASLGARPAQDYLAAYLIEKSLSVDNLFVFLLIFRSLKIPPAGQRAVLTWGILGALVFRLLFVVLGLAALQRFDWVVYMFGGLLLFGAFRVLSEQAGEKDDAPILRWLEGRLRVSKKLDGTRFFVREDGVLRPTRLVLAVVALELTDVVFAVDSVPAAFSVARNPFIVYTSNAFAILGLRSLYVVLADVLGSLRYLHYGLAGVLTFAGLKMLLLDVVHVPPLLSVLIIIIIITGSVLPSLRHRTG